MCASCRLARHWGLTGCAALTLPPNKPLARSVLFRGAYEEFPSGLRPRLESAGFQVEVLKHPAPDSR